jgi:hypothetical protein
MPSASDGRIDFGWDGQQHYKSRCRARGDTMTTNELVTVTGTPTLQLDDSAVATYSSGSGINTLSSPIHGLLGRRQLG